MELLKEDVINITNRIWDSCFVPRLGSSKPVVITMHDLTS